MKKAYFIPVIILLGLLPFHPFLSTAIGQMLSVNPQIHAESLSLVVKAWKELLIVFVLAIATVFWLKNNSKNRFDSLDLAILSFTVLSSITGILLTGAGFPENIDQVVFGFKYGILFLLIIMLCRHVPLTPKLKDVAINTALISGTLVITFGLLQAFVLPEDFLVKFGYNAEYGITEPHKAGSLSYCHKIENTITHQEECRVQSTLSGPNQLGAYLLLILPLFYFQLGKRLGSLSAGAIGLAGGATVLFFTKSRSAWLGAIAMATAFFITSAKRPWFAIGYLTLFGLGLVAMFFPALIEMWDQLKPISLLLTSLVLALMLMIFFINIRKEYFSLIGATFFPAILTALIYARMYGGEYFWTIILRPSSTQGHWEQWQTGIAEMFAYPFGLGLGDSGPTSARFANPGETGSLPESWYIQVGLESGFLGLALFLTAMIILGIMLLKTKHELGHSLFLSLIGISTAALFLHTWESAVVAYSFALLCAIALAPNEGMGLAKAIKRKLVKIWYSLEDRFSRSD
jgi:hypothetical protein